MPKTDPAEQPHPAPLPRAWDCAHCNVVIGHMVRESGVDVLYYRAFLFPRQFVSIRIERHASLLCPYCGKFTDWAPPIPRYDAERIERDINCLKSEIDKINEESHEC